MTLRDVADVVEYGVLITVVSIILYGGWVWERGFHFP
jgi:Flp pilus assembly pilin Flp